MEGLATSKNFSYVLPSIFGCIVVILHGKELLSISKMLYRGLEFIPFDLASTHLLTNQLTELSSDPARNRLLEVDKLVASF